MLPELVIDTPMAFCTLSPDESVPMKLPATKLSFPVIEIPDVVLYPIMLAAVGRPADPVAGIGNEDTRKALVSLSAAESVPTKLPTTRLPVPARQSRRSIKSNDICVRGRRPPIVLPKGLWTHQPRFPPCLVSKWCRSSCRRGGFRRRCLRRSRYGRRVESDDVGGGGNSSADCVAGGVYRNAHRVKQVRPVSSCSDKIGRRSGCRLGDRNPRECVEADRVGGPCRLSRQLCCQWR